ncbi:MAG: hypothetical protein IPK28_14910 [Devosia sp.]|nr:hypothetical protein [Devosia sp.]
MIPFATEFPVGPRATKAAFIAEVTAWLRGTQYSQVLATKYPDLSSDFAHLRSGSGEELILRELGEKAGGLVGFRHDYPDDAGRIWRTEGVLSTNSTGQGLVRVRTQCIAGRPGATLETPRKPYLIKALVGDGWGGQDGSLTVSDQPFRLEDSGDGLLLARAVVQGEASEFLPVVYVSSTSGKNWALSDDQISKLAYDLGGVAHVVVEPSRSFSFDLRERTKGANVYGGTVGLSVPKTGIVRRMFIGWQIPDSRGLADAARLSATEVRSYLPTQGVDWSEVQERALRKARETAGDALTFDQLEESYLEEIAALKEQIGQLKGERASASAQVETATDKTAHSIVGSAITPEIYEGEISDRLSYAAALALQAADRIGLDPRSKFIFQKVAAIPRSPNLLDFRESIKRATKDAKRLASEVINLLTRHGFHEKSDNKHIRLEANSGMGGLDAITLPKTPGDKAHGLENQRKQVEKTLGLTGL